MAGNMATGFQHFEGQLGTGPSVGLLMEGVDVVVIGGTHQPFDARQMKLNGSDPLDNDAVYPASGA